MHNAKDDNRNGKRNGNSRAGVTEYYPSDKEDDRREIISKTISMGIKNTDGKAENIKETMESRKANTKCNRRSTFSSEKHGGGIEGGIPENRDFNEHISVCGFKKHEIKVLPDYFKEVIAGNKNFELRLNDRDYKVGDTVILLEWSTSTGYTGRKSDELKLTYVLTEHDGIWPGWCIFSWKK